MFRQNKIYRDAKAKELDSVNQAAATTIAEEIKQKTYFKSWMVNAHNV